MIRELWETQKAHDIIWLDGLNFWSERRFRMIHEAKNLSPDQKTLIEGLLGRPVAVEDAISIRTIGRKSAPEWLQSSWDSANRLGLDQVSLKDIEAEISAVRERRHR